MRDTLPGCQTLRSRFPFGGDHGGDHAGASRAQVLGERTRLGQFRRGAGNLGALRLCELRSRYLVLLTQLLKWIYQAERRSRSWLNTINIQRDAITQHLLESPGLAAREEDEFLIAYREARMRRRAKPIWMGMCFRSSRRLTRRGRVMRTGRRSRRPTRTRRVRPDCAAPCRALTKLRQITPFQWAQSRAAASPSSFPLTS